MRRSRTEGKTEYHSLQLEDLMLLVCCGSHNVVHSLNVLCDVPPRTIVHQIPDYFSFHLSTLSNYIPLRKAFDEYTEISILKESPIFTVLGEDRVKVWVIWCPKLEGEEGF